MSYIEFLCQVEVEYANGNVYKLPAEFLRIYSPAADSKIRSVAGEKVIVRQNRSFFPIPTIQESKILKKIKKDKIKFIFF